MQVGEYIVICASAAHVNRYYPCELTSALPNGFTHVFIPLFLHKCAPFSQPVPSVPANDTFLPQTSVTEPNDDALFPIHCTSLALPSRSRGHRILLEPNRFIFPVTSVQVNIVLKWITTVY